MEDKRLERLPTETEIEHHKRLIFGKLVDKTLSDEDYVELSQYVYGKSLSSDVCRREMYGSRYTLELFEKDKENKLINNRIDNNVEEDDFIKQLEDKKIALEKERKKLQATKIELNRNLRTDSRFELLYENIREAIERVEVPKFEPIFPISKKKEHVVVFSDVHLGSCFKSITNFYSKEECKNRFNKLLGELITYIQSNKIHTLKIVNGGDSLQGMLRINDVRMNDVPVVEALVEFSKIMIEFLNELSKYCYIEYYHVNSANHTELRLLNTSAGQMAIEDMEKIIVNYISDALTNNERVYVNTDFREDNIQFTVLDYNIIALHGHQLNNIKTALKDLSDKYDKPFDFLILGHYHSGVEITIGERKGYAKETLVCPSFIGTCPYADKLMVGGKSMVKIHVFEKDKGRKRTENIVLN